MVEDIFLALPQLNCYFSYMGHLCHRWCHLCHEVDYVYNICLDYDPGCCISSDDGLTFNTSPSLPF